MSLEPGDRALFLRRALRKRCPQCGDGALFRGFARLNDGCPSCALVFRRESGSQTGAMYVSAVVTEMAAMAMALAMYFFTDWSTPVALTVGTLFILVFSYLFLPVAMACWTAVEYATDVANAEKWVQPRR